MIKEIIRLIAWTIFQAPNYYNEMVVVCVNDIKGDRMRRWLGVTK